MVSDDSYKCLKTPDTVSEIPLKILLLNWVPIEACNGLWILQTDYRKSYDGTRKTKFSSEIKNPLTFEAQTQIAKTTKKIMKKEEGNFQLKNQFKNKNRKFVKIFANSF